MRDKADAMDSLMQQGLLNDPLDTRTGADKELAALRDNHAIESELQMLKAQVRHAPALAAPQQPRLGSGEPKED